MLIVRSNHTQQPQNAFALGGTLREKLAFSVDYAAWGGYEAVRNLAPTITAGSNTSAIIAGMQGCNGLVAGVFANNRVEHYGDLELFPSGVATWQIVELPDSLAQGTTYIVQKLGADINTNCSYAFGYNLTGGRFVATIGTLAGTQGPRYQWDTAGVFSASVPNNIIVTIDPAAGATLKMACWCNGQKLSAASVQLDTAQAGFYDGATNLEIGRANTADLSFCYEGKIVLIRAWDRLLADAEIRELSSGHGPWRVYQPPVEYRYGQDVYTRLRQMQRSLMGVGR